MEILNKIKMPKIKRGAPIKYDFHKIQKSQCMMFCDDDQESLRAQQVSLLATAKRRGYQIRTFKDKKKLYVWVIRKPVKQ